MSQNLISLQLSTADLAALDGALRTVEDKLTGLIDLSIEQRRFLNKMGDKSEAFARSAVEVLGNNPTCCLPTSTWQKSAATWRRSTNSAAALCV